MLSVSLLNGFPRTSTTEFLLANVDGNSAGTFTGLAEGDLAATGMEKIHMSAIRREMEIMFPYPPPSLCPNREGIFLSLGIGLLSLNRRRISMAINRQAELVPKKFVCIG